MKPRREGSWAARSLLLLTFALCALLFTLCAPALSIAAGNEPAHREAVRITLSAEPVAGRPAGRLARLSDPLAHVAAVETSFTFAGGIDWDERNEVWLAALLPARDDPGGVALVWSREQEGFFPTWELRLYANPGSLERLAGGEIAPGASYTALARVTPAAGHLYRAALSVDRSTGDVHVSFFNATQNRPLYQGAVRFEPQEVDLTAAAGGFAQCRRCSGGEWRLVFETAAVSADAVPFAVSWRLLRETPSGLQPLLTTFADRFEPLYAELTLPERPLPGALRLVARAGGRSAVLLDLTNLEGKQVLPVSLAAAPGGALTLALEYEGPAGRWDLLTRNLDAISGEIDLRITADRSLGGDWTGTLIVEGSSFAEPARAFAEPLSLSLDAALYVSRPGGWERAGGWSIVFDDLDLKEGRVSLPLHFPLDLPEPAVVRIAFNPDIAGTGYRVSISPKEIDFLTMPHSEPKSDARDYSFDGSISREVLTNYLSRAITMLGFADPDNAELLDDLRFIANTGAKFIGRAAYVWNAPANDELHFQAAERAARLAHEMDPELILQACIFEAVYEGLEHIPIPAWVFEEFGLPVEERNFDYEAMLFDDGRFVNHWGPGGSVPDMSKLETKMWFFYRAKRYIDAGYEAIHFGQVHLMGQNDPGFRHWQEILERIRAYARKNARRHMLLADAHTHGIVVDGKLLFDFHSYPLRIAEVPGRPMEGRLVKGRIDSIYGRSKPGLTPSGWYADPLPYLVEIDNWGSSGRGGESINEWWVWGYDEISWFAHQDEAYRNEWLRYAWRWVRENDPNGWLQMPAKRVLHDPVNGVGTYRAHTASAANPHGFNQEETIKAIWAEDR